MKLEKVEKKPSAKKYDKGPRMPTYLKKLEDEGYVKPEQGTVLVTLFNKIERQVRVVDLGRPEELPRVLIWEWRAYVQDLSSSGSRNYHEADTHHVWG